VARGILKIISRYQPVLLFIISVSLAIRMIMALALGDSVYPISGAYDQISYDELAQRVVAGYGFTFASPSYPAIPADTPTSFWSFGYTIYLAAVYMIFGHHPLVARVIQVLLSPLNCWLAYRLGKRLFGDWAGLASAALTAGYAYLIFFNAALMTQTFYIIAVMAAFELALALADQPTRRDWVLLGLVLGIGALTRQTLLLFAPILFGWIIWRVYRRVHWKDVLVSFAIIGLLVLPWTVYNYYTFHDFLLLNSNGGFWFFSSNHPEQGTDFDPIYVAPIPEDLKGLPEPAEDRALFQRGLGFVVSDPARFLRLTVNRLKDYYWMMPSENSSLVSNIGRVLSFPLYLPFMVYGLYLSRRRWKVCAPLYLFVIFEALFSLVSWAAPRYRLPSDALLMVFAGLAVVSLARNFGIKLRAENFETKQRVTL
jgi:4-amino-4-deoxy-L-arabinose transferase-like glycosyltransferase